jgi:prepilin-type N-terminal cleavage/methylation domain-containing protein
LLALSSGLAREDAVAGRQKGFSLIELVVAMTVTLIITGAVFQLVTAGKGAFRREPALSDRQQNIRVAMDLISQEVYKAGYGTPPFSQVFTRNLNGVGPTGPSGVGSDQLEFVITQDCGFLTVCKKSGTNLFTNEELNSCFKFPAVIMLGCDTGTGCPAYDFDYALERGAAPDADCKAGHVNTPPGQSDLNPPGGKHNFIPQWIVVGSIIRYRIHLDAEGVPNLERSTIGGANDLDGNSSWEIVARGVEDLQVRYETAIGWSDDPGATSDATSIVRRVRVALSARTTGGGQLQGETTSAVGTAVRGQLVSDIAPRAAAATLGIARGEF